MLRSSWLYGIIPIAFCVGIAWMAFRGDTTALVVLISTGGLVLITWTVSRAKH